MDAEPKATQQISVLLVDDDPYQLAHLSGLVQKLRPEWRIAAQLSSVVDMAAVLDSVQPHLCILDVLFPGTTSLAVVRELGDICPVVFVTGDALFAAEAFDCDAVDYVLKPVRADRFEQALRKVESTLSARSAELGLRSPRTGAAFRSIRFLRGQDLVWSPLSAVRYFQAQRKYTRVVLKDQEGLMRLGLNLVHQHLRPSDFMRIHRGFVVNVNHIEGARRDDFGRLMVRMAGRDDKLIVSKPYEHLFRDGFS
ncbi:MAG: LytR/AlgR family response regulator transcription factor [Janthinobacterium lividum]